MGAQWLYEFILTSAGLNLCGVMDWRPAKWTGMSADATRERLEEWAAELEREHFVVIDRDKEEVLIRAFFRHDGILSQPNPMKGAAREFATIGSALIRGVISHELSRLEEDFPKGVGRANVWELVPELRTLRKTPPIDIRNPSENPSGNPSRTSTSTSTSTETTFPPGEEPKLKETRLPADWVPTTSHYERAKAAGIDIADAVENFRLHAETHDRRAASWNGAFTTWLKKTNPGKGRRVPAGVPVKDEWRFH
jgi:hypothetical protein